MNRVSESIFSNKHAIIPMADVQHIEKRCNDDGTLEQILIITKHGKWDMKADCWSNNIHLPNHDGSADKFIAAWCYYRYEIEGGEEAFKKP